MKFALAYKNIHNELIKSAGDNMQNGYANDAENFPCRHFIFGIRQMQNHCSRYQFGYLNLMPKIQRNLNLGEKTRGK